MSDSDPELFVFCRRVSLFQIHLFVSFQKCLQFCLHVFSSSTEIMAKKEGIGFLNLDTNPKILLCWLVTRRKYRSVSVAAVESGCAPYFEEQEAPIFSPLSLLPPRHYNHPALLHSTIAPPPPSSLLVQALLAEAKAASPTLCGETCVPSLDEIWARTTPCNIFERMHLHLQGSAEPCAYSWKISKLIQIVNHTVEYPHFSSHPSKVGSSNLCDIVNLLLDRLLGSEPSAQVLLTCQLGNKQEMFYFLLTINRF